MKLMRNVKSYVVCFNSSFKDSHCIKRNKNKEKKNESPKALKNHFSPDGISVVVSAKYNAKSKFLKLKFLG